MSDLIKAAAERAVEFQLHPLGFFYLRDEAGDGCARRVHLWLPGGLDASENERHQHTFDLESAVATGRMRSELYRFVEDEDGAEAEYSVRYAGSSSSLVDTGRRGRLVEIAAFDTPAGSSYTLAADVIHRVSVVLRPTITIVRTRERNIPIFAYGCRDEPPFERRHCTSDEALEIQRLLSETANSGSFSCT